MARKTSCAPFEPAELPVRVRCHWVEPHRRRDIDNVAAAKKFILDGLVVAGVLPGDGWGSVGGFVDSFAVGEIPGVDVTVECMR